MPKKDVRQLAVLDRLTDPICWVPSPDTGIISLCRFIYMHALISNSGPYSRKTSTLHFIHWAISLAQQMSISKNYLFTNNSLKRFFQGSYNSNLKWYTKARIKSFLGKLLWVWSVYPLGACIFMLLNSHILWLYLNIHSYEFSCSIHYFHSCFCMSGIFVFVFYSC